MAVPTYNIPDHYQGDWWPGLETVTVTVDDVALNLTGAKIIMHVKRSAANDTVAAKFSTTPDTGEGTITLTDASSGIFKVEPKIVNIPAGDYVYDIEVQPSDGKIVTVLVGTWSITRDITSE